MKRRAFAALLALAGPCGVRAEAGPAAPDAPGPATVRLMVLNEVTSRSAHPGDRFPLLVDRAVVHDGAVVAPVGTRAWGEVVETHENGSAGTAGRLRIRLLWIDAPGGRIPLAQDDRSAAGNRAFAQTALVGAAMGIMAPLALLARGNNAKFKAGEIVEGVPDWSRAAPLQAGEPAG